MAMKPVAVKKWIPAVAVPALIAAAAVGAAASANAELKLDPKSPQEILQMIANSKGTDFSGNLEATVDLGIPQLPDPGEFGPSDTGPSNDTDPSDTGDFDAAKLAQMLSMVSGTHEARVYVDKPDKVRLQVMDGMDEQDFIRNGPELWHYDSATNTVDKATVPDMPERQPCGITETTTTPSP